LTREIIEQFFVPVSLHTRFVTFAEEWLSNKDHFPWDTSIFKITDNLIIGAVQDEKQVKNDGGS